MPLFSKKQSSFTAKGSKSHRFLFSIHVHALSPWPTGYGALVLEWERGAKRKGRSQPAMPRSQQGTSTSYSFESSFVVPCTLYQARPAVGAVNHHVLRPVSRLPCARGAASTRSLLHPACPPLA